jgi:hypothetical protein
LRQPAWFASVVHKFITVETRNMYTINE